MYYAGLSHPQPRHAKVQPRRPRCALAAKVCILPSAEDKGVEALGHREARRQLRDGGGTEGLLRGRSNPAREQSIVFAKGIYRLGYAVEVTRTQSEAAVLVVHLRAWPSRRRAIANRQRTTTGQREITAEGSWESPSRSSFGFGYSIGCLDMDFGFLPPGAICF